MEQNALQKYHQINGVSTFWHQMDFGVQNVKCTVHMNESKFCFLIFFTLKWPSNWEVGNGLALTKSPWPLDEPSVQLHCFF